MAEEIAFENGRISDFRGLVTLTLTYIPNFTKIEETFSGRTFETGFISSRPKNYAKYTISFPTRAVMPVFLPAL